MQMEAIDHIHCGAQVYWPARNACGLTGHGYIFGFIWDVEIYGELWGLRCNGAVIEFPYREHTVARFFVPQDVLESRWFGTEFEIQNSDVLFLEIVDVGVKLTKKNMDILAYCCCNRRRVPVWTPYYYTERKL